MNSVLFESVVARVVVRERGGGERERERERESERERERERKEGGVERSREE
jgi:hypothetical protein